jgi:hypothetical protein
MKGQDSSPEPMKGQDSSPEPMIGENGFEELQTLHHPVLSVVLLQALNGFLVGNIFKRHYLYYRPCHAMA